MGKIYSGIEGIKAPDLGKFLKICKAGDKFKAYDEACNKYVEDVKAQAKAGAVCPEAGEEVDFPYADGYARYVIVSLKPIQLVHMDVGDAWHYPHIERLTAADIRKELNGRKALDKLFRKTQKA